MTDIKWLGDRAVNHTITQTLQDVSREATSIARDCVNTLVVDPVLDLLSFPIIDTIEEQMFEEL